MKTNAVRLLDSPDSIEPVPLKKVRLAPTGGVRATSARLGPIARP